MSKPGADLQNTARGLGVRRGAAIRVVAPPMRYSPMLAIVLGGLGTLFGLICLLLFANEPTIWLPVTIGLLFSLVVLCVGVNDLERHLEVKAEIERAQAEWDELRRVLTEARLAGDNVARLLQQRGYRSFRVRRWIARSFPRMRP